jgi:predicted DNA-binding transcriptional regulator AlpA
MTTDRFIRLAELRAKYVPVAKSTIYLWVEKGLLPAPYALGGGKAVAWKASEIQHWMDSRESRAS